MSKVTASLLLLAVCPWSNVSALAEGPGFENLAARARISASSELSAQKLLAGGVADGRVAPLKSGVFEFYPPGRDARSWAVDGAVAEDRGELSMEWDEPVEVREIVYFARVAFLVEECFKKYEIFIDDAAAPVVQGELEKTDRGQRIRLEPTKAKKLVFRFLSSWGGPNPGATEILVLGEEVSDAQLAVFAPRSPPREVRPDPLEAMRLRWTTPSDKPQEAMPTGNGRVLANVRTEPGGDVCIDLARRDGFGDRVERLGTLRARLDPPLIDEGGRSSQTLMYTNGAIHIEGETAPARPTFSVAVDASQDVLHLQLRCRTPLGIRWTLDSTQVLDSKEIADRARVVGRSGKHACVLLGDGMKAEPGGVLISTAPGISFDLQAHVVGEKAAEGDQAAVTLEQAIASVSKADVNGAIRGHKQRWLDFWGQGTVFVDGDGGDALHRALVERRFVSACSGRGPHLLSLSKEGHSDEPATRSVSRWPEERIRSSMERIVGEAREYLEATAKAGRFPGFWGAGFERLPASTEPIDETLDLLRDMLVTSSGADGKTIHLMPGWPEDRDVWFRISPEGAPASVWVEATCEDGGLRRVEVYPKQRTGDVVGVGPFEKPVQGALAGSFRMPALVSFLSPSWVASKAGMDGLAVTMKKAHFNGYEGNILDAEFCKKHGFYLIVHGVDPWVAHELKDHPQVISYFMSDRKKPSSFARFGRRRTEYEAIDPNHPTEFNTYAHWGGIEYFLDVVRPRMLEYYDYHWKRKKHLHFHYLEYYRRMSIAAGGIPVFRFVHVHDDPPEKMRKTVSMSVLYGLKGFKWWVGWTMFDIHEVKENEPPPLSGIGKEVMRINKMLHAFSPHLARARSVDVFHTRPLPASTREAPPDYWVRPGGEHIAIGVFENDKEDGLIVVGNRDIGRVRDAVLSFDGSVKKVRQLDKATRKWIDLGLDERGGGTTLRLGLDKGDVELLRALR